MKMATKKSTIVQVAEDLAAQLVAKFQTSNFRVSGVSDHLGNYIYVIWDHKENSTLWDDVQAFTRQFKSAGIDGIFCYKK
jgi:hypothetical protein